MIVSSRNSLTDQRALLGGGGGTMAHLGSRGVESPHGEEKRMRKMKEIVLRVRDVTTEIEIGTAITETTEKEALIEAGDEVEGVEVVDVVAVAAWTVETEAIVEVLAAAETFVDQVKADLILGLTSTHGQTTRL